MRSAIEWLKAQLDVIEIDGLGTRIKNKFSLKETIPRVIRLLPFTFFFSSIDKLLQSPQLEKSAAIDISGVAGTYVPMLTVPAGKRWTVNFLMRSLTTANSRLVALDSSQGASTMLEPVGTAETFHYNLNLLLDEGDTLGMLTTGDGGDASKRILAWVIEEAAY